MALFVSYFLTALACLMAIPVFVFFIEIAAGLLRRGNTVSVSGSEVRKRVAVLVPAHNEGDSLRPTLNNIKQQLFPGDRLVVVADNCVDDTKAVAEAAGAEAIERIDPSTPGKGYALDFGLAHLASNPPDVVIVVDADCHLAAGSIDRLALACAATNRPVQSLDLMNAPNESSIKYHVAEFAWRVKNWVRPLGLKALNLPCQLMGSGMAFPWDVIRAASLAHGSTVEDIQLGLELAEAGSHPLFCPAAKVTSCFPTSLEAAQRQRKRWEEGHIGMILGAGPRFFWAAICRGNLGLLALVLDLIVPPLSLLVLLVTAMLVVAGAAAAFGAPPAALFITLVSFSVLAASVLLAWIEYGRDVLPMKKLLSIPGYVLAKLPLYHQILSRRTTPKWVRTDRSGPIDLVETRHERFF